MNFSRVKLVMILCLIAANIIIGYFCAGLYSEKYYISEEETQLSEKHLSGLGVNVNFSREDRKKLSLPVYAVDGIEDNSQETIPTLYKEASEAFFGRTILDSEYVDIPGGFSVSIKNNEGIAVGTSAFTRDMHFECILEEYSDKGIIDRLSESFFARKITYSENPEAENVAQKFVKEAFSKTELTIKKLGLSEYDDGYIVYFGVFLSDTPLVDMYLNMFVKDDRVVCLYAELSDSVPVKAYSTDPSDSVDALYTFLRLYNKELSDVDGNDTVSINDIGVMYKMTENKSGGYYFIPAWKIEYTDAQGAAKIALFDAIVGENSYSMG